MTGLGGFQSAADERAKSLSVGLAGGLSFSRLDRDATFDDLRFVLGSDTAVVSCDEGILQYVCMRSACRIEQNLKAL